MRKSAIDAIRQNGDISIRSRRVKTSRLTRKLFGFEGMIAAKNYKRSRKKYRATVISLFLSIVLFISASSFCAYLTYSARNVTNDNGYDLVYYLHETEKPLDELYSALSGAQGITDATYAARFYFTTAVNTHELSQNMQDYRKNIKEQMGEEYREYEQSLLDIFVIFLADDDFCACLEKQNIAPEDYFDTAQPKAVIMDSLRLYQEKEHKFYHFPAFTDTSKAKLSAYLMEERDDYSYAGFDIEENGRPFCRLFDENSDKEVHMPLEDCLEIPFAIGAAIDEPPALFSDNSQYVRLFYPYSMMEYVFAEMDENTSYYDISDPPVAKNHSVELLFQGEDHNAAYAEMTNILTENSLSASSLYDYAASEESNRAMVNVINIFSYGFITLISLIAAANVFNTISTNINLRRREFAMLKSIGMTPESFRKMMNYECLLYGFKGLLYGLPVSFIVTLLIYRSICEGLEMAFFIPWYSIAIAVGSVFLVVFATMVYSMRRIRRENTIDALKNENL
ncbi:ABC transporter permease [Lachnospiraceae bacterium]|nr:ABC transporter permease [Lachnospiraceae bacterium]